MEDTSIRKIVREGYSKIAKQNGSCCAANSPCPSVGTTENISRKVGYTEEELKAVPEGANLGLGCGNPVALASLREGETVLDLGSGAGFDCFLAARRVGGKGKVIGVDMTPEMIEKARESAQKGNYGNVEFRLGEIENLPVADNMIDVVISNCVINLSPDKEQVFKEASRVLRPGGRLMISDIVLLKELPSSLRSSVEAYVGCISGAVLKDEYLRLIKKAGFHEVHIVEEKQLPVEGMDNDPTVKEIISKLNMRWEELSEMARSAVSVRVKAEKLR